MSQAHRPPLVQIQSHIKSGNWLQAIQVFVSHLKAFDEIAVSSQGAFRDHFQSEIAPMMSELMFPIFDHANRCAFLASYCQERGAFAELILDFIGVPSQAFLDHTPFVLDSKPFSWINAADDSKNHPSSIKSIKNRLQPDLAHVF